MGLHKLVNGQRVDLSPEEEEALKKEWAENEEKIRIKNEENLLKQQKREALKKAMMEKMELSEEDFDLLFSKGLS